MSNYVKSTNFTAKDALTSGDPDKKVKGSEFDTEFDALATAVATKEDSANKGAASGYCGLDGSGLVDPSDLPAATDAAKGAVELATTAEVVTGTDTARAATPAGVQAVLDQNAGMLNDIADLADPNADQLLGWDDSAGAVVGFTAGTGMAFSGTTFACTLDLTNLSATNLTSGSIPDARVPASNVTQHQASLSIAETQIADGSVYPRIGVAETITGAWSFSAAGTITRSGQGRFTYLNGSGNTGGAITLSTLDPSGTPAAGDIWIKYTA